MSEQGTPAFGREPSSRAPFRERLAYYVLGISIGCLLLGFYYSAKQRSVRREAEEQKVREAESQAKATGAAAAGEGK